MKIAGTMFHYVVNKGQHCSLLTVFPSYRQAKEEQGEEVPRNCQGQEDQEGQVDYSSLVTLAFLPRRSVLLEIVVVAMSASLGYFQSASHTVPDLWVMW